MIELLHKLNTKTVDGVQFPSTAFAYVPDAEKPSTWKLRLFDAPGDVPEQPSVRLTAAAVMALSPGGFRGQQVEIPDADLAAVKRKVRAAWLKARADRDVDPPSVLKVADEVLAVPQTEKGDLAVSDLATQGGLLTDGPKAPKRERVGVFVRIPPPIAKEFPPKEQDDSPPHVTMLQAGEHDGSGFDAIVGTVQVLAKELQPFEVELTGYNEFVNDKGFTIAHVVPKTKEGGTPLEDLHAKLREAVAAYVVLDQGHPFVPHATLAYVEEGKTYDGPKPTGTFKVESIEVWGDPGGEFGRVVVALGSGEIVRRLDSDKRGADAVALSKRDLKILRKAEEEEERTVFGVVLEPETIDSQSDIYSEDEIRKTAWRWMERYQQCGLMHAEIVRQIVPLESYIAPADFEINGQKVKKGTWLLRVRVLDDAIWQDVKSGRLTGFSIGGSAIRTPEHLPLAQAA